MLRMLPTLLVLGFSLYCFLDVLLHPSDEPRGLPKALWAVVVLFFPLVGGIAWLVMKGREPRPRRTWRVGGGFPEDERPPLGPEDDPGWRPGQPG